MGICTAICSKNVRLPAANEATLGTYQYLYHALSPIAREYILSFLIQSSSDKHIPMRLWIFSCLRATLAGMTACCELAFLASLERYSKPVALATGLLLLTSTGMAHASGAYLPSSTIMCFWCTCAAAYLRGNVLVFIGAAVVATLAVGWPFGVIVFLPMGLHILIGCDTRRLSNFCWEQHFGRLLCKRPSW